MVYRTCDMIPYATFQDREIHEFALAADWHYLNGSFSGLLSVLGLF